MSQEAGQIPVGAPSRTICEHERVRLPGGWSGQVMTGCSGQYAGDGSADSWPNAEQWCEWLAQLVSAPDRLPGYAVLKQSGKGHVFRARLDLPQGALEVVCKRSPVRGVARRALQIFRLSASRTQHERALGLLRARVRTALPLGYLERGLTRSEAWSITKFVDGAVDLDRIALAELNRVPVLRQRFVRNGVIEALAELFDHLEMNNIRHRDLKASNVILTNWDQGPQVAEVWLIDLEGVRLGAGDDEAQQWRAVARLVASLMHYKSITRGDYVRFVQALLSGWGTQPSEWRKHFHRVAVAARNYLMESKRRKQGKLDGYADGV